MDPGPRLEGWRRAGCPSGPWGRLLLGWALALRGTQAYLRAPEAQDHSCWKGGRGSLLPQTLIVRDPITGKTARAKEDCPCESLMARPGFGRTWRDDGEGTVRSQAGGEREGDISEGGRPGPAKAHLPFSPP